MAYLAQPASLEIRNTSASVALPASPAVFVAPTIVSAVNMAYDNTTGILTFLQSETYDFDLMFNVSSLLGGTLNYSAQVDTGGGFTDIAFSGRMGAVAILSNQQILFSSSNYFREGTRVRFNLWATGTMTLVTSTLPNSTVQVPAARILAAS